jgi:NADH dehydrogenase FAD-containing subunit
VVFINLHVSLPILIFTIQIPTRGPRPRTEFVAKSLGANTLDERNQIKVTPTLQLIDHPDIFAVGDAINTVEQKQVMKAIAHGGIVTANIIAYLSGGTLKPYKGSTEMIVVTNGKVSFTSLI